MPTGWLIEEFDSFSMEPMRYSEVLNFWCHCLRNIAESRHFTYDGICWFSSCISMYSPRARRRDWQMPSVLLSGNRVEIPRVEKNRNKSSPFFFVIH